MIHTERRLSLLVPAAGLLVGLLALLSPLGSEAQAQETAGGPRVYVANSGDDAVSVVDPARNEVVATVPVGREPHQVLATRDGSRVYVGNFGEDTVSVIDASSLQEVDRIKVGRAPTRLAATPDGRFV
nr:YncE family protein [Actinomycetota bacterium]